MTLEGFELHEHPRCLKCGRDTTDDPGNLAVQPVGWELSGPGVSTDVLLCQDCNSLPPLAAVRRELGWTQGDLQRASGVTRSTISRIESGEHACHVNTAISLARALGVAVEAIQWPGRETE